MAGITVAPNSDEWELGQAELEDLVEALKADGHDAWLQEPRDGQYGAGGVVSDPLIDLSLFVWENVSEAVIGAMVGMAIEKLRRRGKRKPRATAVVYGPHGEELSRFEIPPDDEEE